jgi:hypothetical protein
VRQEGHLVPSEIDRSKLRDLFFAQSIECAGNVQNTPESTKKFKGEML